MRLLALTWVLLLSGCELFPVAVDPSQVPRPRPPVRFEFSYINSHTFPGYIRFRNHCSGIVQYHWRLGFFLEDGTEATSSSSAPVVQFPHNGTFRVNVQGVDAQAMRYEVLLSVVVNTY